MKGVIDKIEDSVVVFEKEDRSVVEMNKKLFPENIKVGDIVVIEGEQDDQNSINVVILNEETENRRKEIKNRFQRLIKKKS